MPFLPMNMPTPKFWWVVYLVLAATRGRLNTETAGRAVEAVLRTEVAARRIAHHLERELRIDHAAIRTTRRPWQANAEQAALEQQRVRGWIRARQVRAVLRRRSRRRSDPCPASLPSARGCCAATRSCRLPADGRSRRRGRWCRWARRRDGPSSRNAPTRSGCPRLRSRCRTSRAPARGRPALATTSVRAPPRRQTRPRGWPGCRSAAPRAANVGDVGFCMMSCWSVNRSQRFRSAVADRPDRPCPR